MLYKFDDNSVHKRKSGHLLHLIQKHLVSILQSEINDPRIKWVTINKIEFSKQKSLIYAYYSVLGGDEELNAASKALKSASSFIKTKLASRMTVYKTPTVKFIFDVTSIAKKEI